MLDVQLKRGMLEVCVLRCLADGDSYGYQIVRQLGDCVAISESTLYPILRRLEAAGALETYSVAHNSRLRRFYHLTTAGQDRIRTFLEEWQEVQKIYDFIRREGTNHDEA